MFKKLGILLLIIICILGFSLSTVSSQPINAKITNIGNSVGTLRLVEEYTHKTVKEEWVNPGETINYILDVQDHLTSTLRFHSVGRSSIYDATLLNVPSINHDFSLSVVFYKETGYTNKIITPRGPKESINYDDV
jgi:hypothetical protein